MEEQPQFTAEGYSQILAGYAKALSHPARVRILLVLLGHSEQLCGQLVESLALAQSTVSQHLRELVRTGIVKARPQGTRMYYSIDRQAWQTARQFFEGFFAALPAEAPEKVAFAEPTAETLAEEKPAEVVRTRRPLTIYS